MPCHDFVNGRLEKSVPPKKSLSWRSHNITLPEHPTHHSVLNYSSYCTQDSKPDCGEIRPLNMGPNSVQADLQSVNGHGFESLSPPKNVFSDMPLDFSVKPENKNFRSEDTATSPQGGQRNGLNSFDYPFKISNEERNGTPMVHLPNGIHPHYSIKTHKNVQKPVKTVVSPMRKENVDYIDIDLSQMNAKFAADTQRTKSPSPHLQNSNSLSKSPILAGILAGGPPDTLPTVETLNSRIMPFGLSNGYPNTFNAMCIPGGIQNSIPVVANPSLFPPSNIIAASGLALMQSHMNLMPPVAPIPLQSKIENKSARKGKQERPFKNYDVSLQDDLTQCNNLTWPVIATINSRAINENSQPDANHPEPVTVSSPTRANPVHGNSENSSPSDPAMDSEMDNQPHSSMPNNVSEEGTETDKNNRGRKRKPVAESQKDAIYWERRKKNNQAAKRSRENRRIKEDTVAQQAVFFRGEFTRVAQMLLHATAQVRDYEMKCQILEQDKLNLTSEIGMYKQALSQKRCGQCGNTLGN